MIFDWISFYFIFLEIIIFFPLWHLIFFKKKKIGERKRYDPWKNSKKKKKTAQKNIIILSSNLNCTFGLEKVEIWFSLFLEKLYRIEFPLDKKKTNLESIEILHRKLEPKYKTGSEDNTSSTSSSTSFQNSNRDQHQIRSSLFK